MCKRRDSISAVSAAADDLATVCEAEIRGVPSDRPARAGVAKAIREAIRDLTATPTDMALQLRRMK